MSVFFDAFEFSKCLLNRFSKNSGYPVNEFNGKIVGFDYGTHKIGVSISDAEYNFAFPKTVLIGEWRDIDNACKEIIKYCNDNHILFVVFGYPIKNNGELNENCNRILQIANFLDKKGFEILLFDERFSTKASVAVFNYEKRRNNKKNILENKYDDAGAASIILQDVLKILNQIKQKSVI